MERIGVRELRQNASRYLRRAEAGEVIEVTDRGRPVARLIPPGPMSMRDRLIAEGKLIPARRDGDLLTHEPIPSRPGLRPLSEIIDELREERLP